MIIAGGRARQNSAFFSTLLEKIALRAVMILAFLSFGLAAFLPVYTDEIGWKIVQGRLGYDGFYMRKLAPSCGPDAFTLPPLMVPFHLLNTLMYQWISGPLPIRLIGIGFFVLWLAGTWLLLQRLVPPLADRWTIAGASVAFVTLGVMPFLMVISRPEQPLLIGITVLLLICMEKPNLSPRSLSAEIMSAIVLVFGCVMVLASHPRAIFALPLMAIATLKVLSRRTLISIVMVSIIYSASVAYKYWTNELSCDVDFHFNTLLGDYSIVAAISSGNFVDYFTKLENMLIQDQGHFFFLSAFGFYSSHTSGIIPDYPWHWVAFPITLTVSAFVGAMSGCGFCAFVIVVIEAIRQHRISPKVAALASVWALLFVSLFARAHRQDYEATLIEPLLGLVTILSVWTARDWLCRWLGALRFERIIHSALSILLLLSIVSQVALIGGYSRNAVGSWITAGYPKDQKWSVANFGYGRLRTKILETAAMCGINPKNHPHHLVVDEVTYFALRQAHQPFLTLYLDENTWGSGINDVSALLTQQHSAGMVVGCQWVPSKLRSEAIVNGGFCCIPSFGR